jgi:TPP-dependent 2-oxoacid decarboxylase
MTTATATTTVGSYLAVRLVQLDVTHLFGLPGDFNLTLLDELLAVEGLDWSGSTNELNAAYTADGYARAGRRPGALVRDALQGASDPENAWLIEVMLPRLDVPRPLVQLARGKRATNSTTSKD